MAETVQFRGTRGEFSDAMRDVLGMVSGRVADVDRIGHGVQLRVGVATLSQVQQDFLVKSRGGTGRDGVTWPPLSPKTIAQRRTTAGERKALGITKDLVRGLLTPTQDKRWRQLYAGRLNRMLAKGVDPKAAKGEAARFAWAMIKKEGGRTKLEVLGKRQVDILRDTGELFRSFSPGVEESQSHADGQVFRTPPGAVIVGSNKKPQHHAGIPKRLPARPFWPSDGSIPEAWWPAIRRALASGLAKGVKRYLSHRPGG